jgi:SAM-dependent methyltransferase
LFVINTNEANMDERVMPASKAHRLDDPERPRFLPPDAVLNALPLSPGIVIADVGAGTGYFSFPLAKAIGTGGRLFAVDIQDEMLSLLRQKLNRADAPDNIVLVHGEAKATTLVDHSCDLVFLANVWHEIPDHAAALQETRRILKANGTLAILDWRPDTEHPPGPPLEHRIPAQDVCRDLRSHGFRCDSPLQVGQYSYIVVAK